MKDMTMSIRTDTLMNKCCGTVAAAVAETANRDFNEIADLPPAKTPTRRSVLEAAIKTVCNDRQDQYGEPENNFKTIAGLWTAYLRAAGVIEQHGAGVVEPHDVAAMMCMLKLARIATGVSKMDNWVDLAGYAALGGEVEGV